jgi:biotin carboxylase
VRKILVVSARNGTPLSWLLPRIAARAELHLLTLGPLPEIEREVWEPVCASITDCTDEEHSGDALVELIVGHARRLGVHGLTTAAEYAVIAVAEAARRLGLPGAGPHADRARDKRLMRQVWEDAGVPVPRFRPVADLAGLRAAVAELSLPVLLKPAWSGGSIGQYVIGDPSQADAAWEHGCQAMQTARKGGLGEFTRGEESDAEWVVEEIILGSCEGWYDEDVTGYGDYLSVEGIVDGGVYHPICITARMPNLPTFTEPANLAPCVLSEERQRRIEALARAAIDALELETCGLHTEVKLVKDGAYLIETSARFGGCLLVREVEDVTGFDLVGSLTSALVGEQVEYPEQMIVAGHGAAASLALVSSYPDGRPWEHQRIWDDQAVDWDSLLPPGVTVEIVRQMTLPAGTPIPRYDPMLGGLNWSGIFYVWAPDAATLLTACNRILDGMENQLPRAASAVPAGLH